MSDINHWLRLHPRSSPRGAPMGQPDQICETVIKEILDGVSHPIYVQRLVVEDADYDLSGTYWGFGSGSSPVWCGYTLGVQGEHDNGIRIFVRASDLSAAKQAIQDELEAVMGEPYTPDFRSPGEEAIYTEILDSLPDLVKSYLDTARFADMGPDSGIPEDLPFNKETQFEATVDIIGFIDTVHDDTDFMINGTNTWVNLVEVISAGTYSLSQFADDIWYTRNHHGVGFWDRGLGALGNRLTTLAHSLGERSVYTNDGKVVAIE